MGRGATGGNHAASLTCPGSSSLERGQLRSAAAFLANLCKSGNLRNINSLIPYRDLAPARGVAAVAVAYLRLGFIDRFISQFPATLRADTAELARAHRDLDM
jgi:hypothetical protein